ncbi:MAG TPA: hypothetical protein VEA17_22370, partial [Bordetella sp.]|nr:hypothetical protein [Bordetella sp.]
MQFTNAAVQVQAGTRVPAQAAMRGAPYYRYRMQFGVAVHRNARNGVTVDAGRPKRILILIRLSFSDRARKAIYQMQRR